MDLATIKKIRGPGIAHPLYEGIRFNEKERINQVLTEGLRITISSRLDLSSPGTERRITELLHIAKHEQIDIHLAPGTQAEISGGTKGVNKIEFRDRQNHVEFNTSDAPGKLYGIDKPLQYQHLMGWFGLDKTSASNLYLEILSHRKLGNEIFLTNDPTLIHERYNHGFLKDIGIHTDEEACEKVGVVVRRSGSYPVGQASHSDERLDSGLTYLFLARTLIPGMARAFRSALNPENIESIGSTVSHLDTIWSHFVHLLMCLDELAVLHWQDEYIGGNNNLIEKEMYHFQYCLLLASSILENLAWTVAKLDQAEINDARNVSFNILVKGKAKWVRQLSISRPMSEFIQNDHRTLKLLSMVELRHLIAHRGGLQSMVGSIINIIDRDKMVFNTETRYGMVLVNLEETKFDVNQKGVVHEGDHCSIIPYIYAKWMVLMLARYLDEAFSKIHWLGADWVKNSYDSALMLSARGERHLLDLLGPID